VVTYECTKCFLKQKAMKNAVLSHRCPKNNNRYTTFRLMHLHEFETDGTGVRSCIVCRQVENAK
jgi:hypothetical protein